MVAHRPHGYADHQAGDLSLGPALLLRPPPAFGAQRRELHTLRRSLRLPCRHGEEQGLHCQMRPGDCLRHSAVLFPNRVAQNYRDPLRGRIHRHN